VGAQAPTTVARLREVFSSAGFRKFFLARGISQTGDGIFQLSSAAVLLFEHPGRNPTIALLSVTAITLIPFSVIGPFTGVFIDRWDRHKILVWVPVTRAGVAALLPLAALAGTHSVWFYAVVLFVLSTNRFFLSTLSTVLPTLVPPEDLIVANSAASTGGAVANVTGQGIGSALSTVFSGSTAALFGAALFAGSTALSKEIPTHRRIETRRPGALGAQFKEVAAEMREGFRALGSHPRVRFALTAIGAVQVLVGAMVAVLTYYFIHELHLQVGSATAILAVLALGIGAGVLFVPVFARKVRYGSLIPVGFAIGAIANAISGIALSRTTLFIGAAFAGISYAFTKIPVDTIVQQEMADVVRGRAFAVYDMLFNVARVTGVAIVAFAYERGASTRAIVSGVAVAYVASGIVFTIWEREEPMFKRKRKDQGAPALKAGEMVTVRAHAGARADEEPRAIVTGGHEIPIDSIEWRAVVEEQGRRARIFVVRAGGQRIRLALYDGATSWDVERLLPAPGLPGFDPK